ncbi:hypothetical protein HZS_4892 [Henneguya salminicola]|nr:hypothetical protein HZS_4892 [Henneguya salminicola]
MFPPQSVHENEDGLYQKQRRKERSTFNETFWDCTRISIDELLNPSYFWLARGGWGVGFCEIQPT